MGKTEERVELVRAEDVRPAEGTPAMLRRVAFEAPGLWAGTVTTESGMESGWHHHGAHRSLIYMLEGQMRIEFGPGGGEIVEASAGDFVSVPPGAVHREATPGTAARAVVVRVGEGEVVVNVEGPASA